MLRLLSTTVPQNIEFWYMLCLDNILLHKFSILRVLFANLCKTGIVETRPTHKMSSILRLGLEKLPITMSGILLTIYNLQNLA